MAQSFAADTAGGLDEARVQCEAALAVSRQSTVDQPTAKALNCLGEVAYFRQELDEALDFFRRAQQLWDKAGDDRGRAQTLLLQGYVALWTLSRFDQALDPALERAQALWASLGDKREQAITLVADSRLQQRRGAVPKSAEWFLEGACAH